MFLLERQIYREEDLLSDDSPPKWAQRPMLCQSKARSLFPGLLRGCRVLDCLPRPQAGSWMGSGAAEIRTGAHMGSRACKARTSTTAPPRRALKIIYYLKGSVTTEKGHPLLLSLAMSREVKWKWSSWDSNLCLHDANTLGSSLICCTTMPSTSFHF